MDSSNRLVDGLTRDSFSVLEDGKPREITYFSHEPEPTSVVILVDKSRSMRDLDSPILEAVTTLYRALPNGSDVSLIRFNEHAVLSLEHVDDAQELRDKLARVPADGHTALVDAAYLGLEQLTRARAGKRVLAIFSDGGENASRFSEKDLKEVAQESDAQVYLLAVFPKDAPRPMIEDIESNSIFRDVCVLSGGQFIVVDQISRLEPTMTELALMLQKQYIIGFPAEASRSDKKAWHRLAVKVRSGHSKHGGYATTRAGFLTAAK